MYTNGTVRAAEAYSKRTGGTDILSGLDRKLFAAGAKWNVIEEKKDGSTARVVILITSHPARNMIGYRAKIPMRFEDGFWRIDRESTIKTVLKNMN